MKKLDSATREAVERGLAVMRARMRDAIDPIGFAAASAFTGRSASILHRYLKGVLVPQISVITRLAIATNRPIAWFFDPQAGSGPPRPKADTSFEDRVRALRAAQERGA